MSKFGKDVETKWGLYTDETLENKVKFTILATGFGIKDVPGMDNVLKQRSLEEQKRLDDLEEEEQKKDERRSDYYGKSILKSSIRKKRPNIYIFSQEDLANDDIISMVENNSYLQAHQDGTGEYSFESNYRRKDCTGTGNHNQHRLYDNYFLNITKRTTFKLYNEYGFI